MDGEMMRIMERECKVKKGLSSRHPPFSGIRGGGMAGNWEIGIVGGKIAGDLGWGMEGGVGVEKKEEFSKLKGEKGEIRDKDGSDLALLPEDRSFRYN